MLVCGTAPINELWMEEKMTSERTKFRFDFGGITLELTGDREFVQEMYQCVMEDVQEARLRANQQPEQRGQGKRAVSPGGKLKESQALPRSVWVHRADNLMRKIYMVSESDVARSWLAQILDETYISSVFVDKPIFEQVFPELDGGKTLWAEFTSEGRKRLAAASKPTIPALRSPGSKS